jgi:hypothetical protein
MERARETWVNLKGPLAIEEELVKERGGWTISICVESGLSTLKAPNLSLCHRWRTLSGSSMYSSRAHLCLLRHLSVISFESRMDECVLELIFGLSGLRIPRLESRFSQFESLENKTGKYFGKEVR